MGGKKRHSKDRMFITTTEWKTEYGGKKIHTGGNNYRPLPFDHCALSLGPFETPVCTSEGVIFDFVNLAEYIKKHGKNPITGEPMNVKDIVRLNMAKSSEGLWHCPVTYKTFNNNSAVCAIRKTGNVFSLDAVKELNITPKNFVDLISGESFSRSDIIVLQDPSDPQIAARRDINSFEHLKQLRATASAAKASEGTVRHTPTTSNIMQEIAKKQKEEQENPTAKSNPALLSSKVVSTDNNTDVEEILAMRPTVDDVCPGRVISDQRAGGSFTSTAQEVVTRSTVKLASPDDIREARWRKMREVGKKGYVQLQTNIGNLNLEIHCDCAQRTSWNFITLCERGYFDGTVFHRLIPGFMIQGGDPSGTGCGGESAFGKPFRDEFDSRLRHDARGILSMANSGENTNNSQFFITFAPTPHLDLKHCVFGRVVGGIATLDRMEAVSPDKNEVPTSEIKILSTSVMINPIPEANALIVAEIERSRELKKKNEVTTLLGKRDSSHVALEGPIASSASSSYPLGASETASSSQTLAVPPAVGRYLNSGSVSKHAGISSSSIGGAASKVPRTTGSSQADKVAAFMRSQAESGLVGVDGGGIKKKKIGGDFSSW